MLKRTLTVLLFSVLATAAVATPASAQTPPWSDLQASSVLHLSKLPAWVEESQRAQQYEHAAVEMAKQWLAEHDYLFDINNVGVTVHNTGHGLVATFSAGGIHITVVLGPGPIIERPDRDVVDVRMTVLFERSLIVDLPGIYNGF